MHEDEIGISTPPNPRNPNVSIPLGCLLPVGVDGIALSDQWRDRFGTYLGLTIPNLPNLFLIHGPESPSVLFNMPLGAELEAEWIRDCMLYMRAEGIGSIQPAEGTDTAWGEEVAAIADHTLFPQTDSWYTGANIPGKPRVFMPYIGGFPTYVRKCDEVAANGYEGFDRHPSA